MTWAKWPGALSIAGASTADGTSVLSGRSRFRLTPRQGLRLAQPWRIAYSNTDDKHARSRLPLTAAPAFLRASRYIAMVDSSISAGVMWPQNLVRIPKRKYVYCFCVGP